MVQTVAYIEDGPRFPCYAEARTWNGWACPWFAKEVADKIMEWNNEGRPDNLLLTYNAETDTYSVPAQEEYYKGVDVWISGQYVHLYPIGNSCWIWDIED